MSTSLATVPTLTIGDLIDKDGRLQLTEQAITNKRDILEEASNVPLVLDTIADRDQAINVSARLGGLIKEANEDHKRIKVNFLAMCQAIDATKRDYIKELEEEKKKLDRAAGTFEQKRLDTLRREQEERDAAARQAEQDEAARLRLLAEQDEAARKEAPTDRKAALSAELRREEEREQIVADQKAREEQQIRDAELRRQAAASGGTSRKEITVEAYDLASLFRARPDCVRMEPDLVQIKFLWNNQNNIFPLPGIKVEERPVFSAKAR